VRGWQGTSFILGLRNNFRLPLAARGLTDNIPTSSTMLCKYCLAVLKALLADDFSSEHWRPRSPGSNSCSLDYGPQPEHQARNNEATCLMCAMFTYYQCPRKDERFLAFVIQDDPSGLDPIWSVNPHTFSICNIDLEGESDTAEDYELFKPQDDGTVATGPDVLGLNITLGPGVLEGMPLQIPVDPEATGKFILAERWLKECTESHLQCKRRSGSRLPTRVLDIGSEGGLIEPRIITTQGRRDEYVALSHRWTDVSSRFGTTRENLKERMEGIPLASFPPTFRDAIKITKKLGYRYIWIDNISIVQNDKQDWERECQRMCDVFENAVFTISALGESDGIGGILENRKAKQSIILQLKDGTQIGVRPIPQSFETAIKLSEMDTRGWILQERVLSPAILHIGRSQMYWECCSHTALESVPQMKAHSEGRLKHLVVNTQWQSRNRDAPDAYLEWYKMLGIFTGKRLTVEFDRLPAIMGLARRFQNLFNATFLAGLWLEDLHRGLLWMNLNDRIISPLGHSNLPSWSWIRVIGRVEFEGKDAHYHEDPYGPHSIYPMTRESSGTDIDILDVDVSTRLPNPNRKMRAIIQAWGVLVRATYVRSTASTLPHEHKPLPPTRMGYLSRYNQAQRGSLICTIDYLCDELKGCYCLLVADWVFEWAWDGLFGKKKELMTPKQRCYLVLTRVKRPAQNANPLALGEFRRIGVGGDDPSLVEKFFGATRKRFLALV